MITTLAVEGYRSLRELVLELDRLTVVTGPNGSGKTSVYRVLRLLSDVVRDGALSSVAREGGMRSALHAGPRGKGPVALRLGLATDDVGYAIDLGVPQGGPFVADPEVKSEVVWTGPVLRPATLQAERRWTHVRLRDDDGVWRDLRLEVGPHESVMGVLADPAVAPELFLLRERARRWRFYDHLRTDADAPARRPGVATFTPVLGTRGDDLAAALLSIELLGDAAGLHSAVAQAFPGSRLELADDDGVARLAVHQPGLRRALTPAELSDGTLGFLFLAAAALPVRAPDLLVLNEPETSLHPSLLPAVAALVARAAERSQVVVVSHAPSLVDALLDEGARGIELSKAGSETSVVGQGVLDRPAWTWPKRTS